MKKPVFVLTALLAAFIIAGLLFFESDSSAEIRKPLFAGTWYAGTESELKKDIAEYVNRSRKTEVSIPGDKPLRALIMPHAGHIFSGLTAAHASFVLREKQFSKVILMGPDHRVGFRNCAVSDVDAYLTPLGRINLHKDAQRLRTRSELFKAVPESDRQEHSLEVVLPFLQYFLKEFELVPIVVSHVQEKITPCANEIKQITDTKTLLVASSDMSHFLSYEEAVSRDRETINMILNLESDRLVHRDNCACGLKPILVLIKLAQEYGWQPVLLHYSNSGDTAGDRSRVVGYAAIAFYGGLSMKNTNNSAQQFSESQGEVLVRLARHTIMKKLGKKVPKEEATSLEQALTDDDFSATRGTFVTLKKHGNLRGCIGSLTADEPVVDGIRHNALNAAFNDPRFPVLSPRELDQIEIEVSILTDPRPLDFKNGADLTAKLRPHVDGVIIKKGYNRATFLPQVWEQLPRPEDFLSHLCSKAGLSSNAWQDTGLEVQIYQVQYFEEQK